MLAEAKGKISTTGSNLTERLEDNLTGNILGTLRYLPYSIALGPILEKSVFPKTICEALQGHAKDFWADTITFWPYDQEGELDALIEWEDVVIGIEVKYRSGLSSDDDIDNSLEELEEAKEKELNQSINQLARESRIVSRKGRKKKKFLLFIADRNTCRDVYQDITERGIIEKGVLFGYLSWQDILQQLKKLNLQDPYHRVMIQDMINLLKRKGFEDFISMKLESDLLIDSNKYFRFHYDKKVKWSFETTPYIGEEGYYEFG